MYVHVGAYSLIIILAKEAHVHSCSSVVLHVHVAHVIRYMYSTMCPNGRYSLRLNRKYSPRGWALIRE